MPLWLLKDLLNPNCQEIISDSKPQPYDKRLFVAIKNYVLEVGRCYISAGLGFVGISFFLLPVIIDQKLVQIASINFSTEYLPQNRLLLDGLLTFRPQLSNHWFETSSGMIPYFWILLAVILLGAIAWVTSRNQAMELWIMISAIALLMTTDLGAWIYYLAPILQKIQFSWRWYGLTITTIPMILGSLVWEIWQYPLIGVETKTLNKTLNKIVITFLVIGLTFSSYIYTDKIVFKHTGFDPALINQFSTLASQKKFPKEPNAEEQGKPILWWHWLFPDGLAIVDVPEYRAKGVTLAMPPDRNQPLASYDDQDSHIQIKQWRFGLREILVDNLTNSPYVKKELTLRMFYYPAWQVWIDDKSAILGTNSQGQVQIPIPQGQHLVRLQYVGTKAEQWGRNISWLVIGITLIYGIWYKQQLLSS
jgi:hypothetical protein